MVDVVEVVVEEGLEVKEEEEAFPDFRVRRSDCKTGQLCVGGTRILRE